MSDAVFYSDDEYDQLAGYIQQLIEEMERLPNPDIRVRVFELLKGLDALHREALARMMQRLECDAPDAKATLASDPVIRTLLGLYDLLPDGEAAPASSVNGFVPLERVDLLSPIRQPVWIPAGRLDDLAPETMTARDFDGERVLLCRVDDEVFAVRNACIGSILPLQNGRLEGYTLTCPWHGCRYDIRTGMSPDYPDERLPVFPVVVQDDGRFSVGFNVGV